MPDIQRSIIIHAPIEQVWEAVVDADAFGAWFGAEFDGPFETGRTTSGRIVPTTIDAEVAAAQEPHRGAPLTLEVTAIEPPSRFAFRWQPVAGSEVRTAVEFTLVEQSEGVLVTITEDGFDALPADMRSDARDGNDGGWDAQTRLLAAYVERAE